MNFLSPILEIFFPTTCVSCGKSVPTQDELFCAHCALGIDFTVYQDPANNEMTRRLIAMQPLRYAVAMLYFVRNSPIQELMHKIKYHQRSELAKRIAETFAEFIKNKLPMSEIDCVTCVPLHAEKKRKRGFNQSEILARTIADLTGVRFANFLTRTHLTETQTHFGRMERLDNQKESLHCNKTVGRVRHLLLIDDVLTTGATIETCSDALLTTNPQLQISVATLSIADNW